MFGLSSTVSRVIVGLAFALCIVGFLYVQSCQGKRMAAAEKRVEQAQTSATVESARDAIATQGAVGETQAAGEELTRTNEKDIRNAKGADAAVDPAVRDAGLASLCRRAAYRASERCLRLTASS